MKFLFFVILIFWSFIEAKKCISVEDEKQPKCPKGEIYQINGPGPFCYATCCGPRGPPCRMDTFTTGCFCKDPNTIKVFPVANNSLADPNNPCVKDCSKVNCAKEACTGKNEEWRECGPTSMCDTQVCRGMMPICTEEDAKICVAGCFCKPGFYRFGECIAECPLLP